MLKTQRNTCSKKFPLQTKKKKKKSGDNHLKEFLNKLDLETQPGKSCRNKSFGLFSPKTEKSRSELEKVPEKLDPSLAESIYIFVFIENFDPCSRSRLKSRDPISSSFHFWLFFWKKMILNRFFKVVAELVKWSF